MNKNRFAKLKRGGGLFVVLALLLIMVLPVAANGTVVSIPDTSAEYCNNVTVAITITDVNNLGALHVQLLYDSSVVELTALASGNIPGGMYVFNIHRRNGLVLGDWVKR